MHRFTVIVCNLLAASVFFLTACSGSVKVKAEESGKWQLAGKIKNNNFMLYYDTSGIKKLSENYIRVRVREELSQEGFEMFKNNFYRSVKEAEEKAGEKVHDPESLLKTLARYETKEYDAEIDCRDNEFRIPQPSTSGFTFMIVNNIEKGSAEEKIKNYVCR